MFGQLFRLLLIVVIAAVGQSLDPSAAGAAGDPTGFIYGTLTTESGNEYVGFLRWDDEEAFWDDLFHSAKENLDWLDYVDTPQQRKHKRTEIKIFDWSLHVEGGSDATSRMIIARFGDIERIDPHGDDAARVTLKSGTVWEVEGASNDVGNKIVVDDASIGRIEVPWERIRSIVFREAPSDAEPPAWRLHARVETDSGDFEGFIQWDKQECLSTDRLDGDTEDGDVSLEMGRLRSIERRGKRSSLVTLKDGRELRLRGSNDVNDENRGIMVEDPRFGRVTVQWDAFDRIVFSDAGGSGRGYDEFPPLGPLTGTVTDRDDQTYHGRIVIDLDESEGWEMLNGSQRDIDYDIPLALVRRLERIDEDGARVELRTGVEVTLYDGQDVTDRNAGVLVFLSEDSEEPEYIPWDAVRRIDFD
jgi:hypothetical protein